MNTHADLPFLKKLFGQFRDAVLAADDQRYEPIYDEHPDLKDYDNAALIRREIQFSEVESLTLLSGFRGSGKSTELNRLAYDLGTDGFLVLQRDALDYLNPGEKIDIVTLLNALAGAFSDALEAKTGIDAMKESYWRRLVHFLQHTKINLTELGLSVASGAKVPAKDMPRAEAAVKLAIQTSPNFRQQLREKLQVRLGELRQEVYAFLDDCRALIRQKRGADAQIVFIFDNFEQIPGAPGLSSQQQTIIEDTKRLFADYLSILRFPFIHTVLTVPSWLKLVLPGTPLRLVANLPLWKKDPRRPRREESYRVLRSLILRRFDAIEPGCMARFFEGANEHGDHHLVDRIIECSGGHFRDLLRLMRECITRAQSLPIDDSIVDQAAHVLRASYLPIAVEDAKALQRVADMQSTSHETSKDEDIRRLAQFMNTHMVLYFVNGDEWYDLHPLIRAEVKEIVRRADVLESKQEKGSARKAGKPSRKPGNR